MQISTQWKSQNCSKLQKKYISILLFTEIFSYTVIWISVKESSICATKSEPFGDAMISILSPDQCL